MSRGVLVFFVCLSSVLATGCENSVASNNLTATYTEPVVGTYKVVKHSFQRSVEFPASVTASKEVTLMSKVPGEIRKIYVSEGDRVRRGQLLIQLDQRDFIIALRQAKAQLAAAAAGVEMAKAGFDTVSTTHARFSALRKEKAVSESNFDDIEGKRRVSSAQLKGAQAQLQLAQVAVEAATANLGYTAVRAPFDGTVGKRLVDEGARVQTMPPTPLMTIVDTHMVKVEGGVIESSIHLISKGTTAKVFVDALGRKPLLGTVDRVEPIVDVRTRTAVVQVILSNSDGRLKTGMSARVLVDLGKKDAPAIPDDTIIKDAQRGSRGEVYIVNGNRVKRREIVLGQRDNDVIEVINGLKDGDLIVRGGQEKLKDGQPISIQNQGGK